MRWRRQTEVVERIDTGTVLLSCRGVNVAYDKVQVLFGVDLEVEQDSHYGNNTRLSPRT